MKVLVVYESMFGSTKTLAEAIGGALGRQGETRVVEVGAFVAQEGGLVPDDVDLLVVGGPTHTFGMSRPGTRAEAMKEYGSIVSQGVGIREWLDSTRLPSGIQAAAFDTRVGTMRLAGGAAARGIHKWLQRLGARTVSPPRSFTVKGRTGGLMDGQVERAREWGAELGVVGRR